MGKFGEGARTGHIGICAQCKNKSEIALYPNDNPQEICEACYRDNCKLEQKIAEKAEAATNTNVNGAVAPLRQTSSSSSSSSPERDRYIDVICRNADPKWVDTFIREVVVKNVLKYDWKMIIQNDRWFSVLDLRRFALDIDPGFETETEKVEPSRLVTPEVKPKRTRTKRNVKGVLANATS